MKTAAQILLTIFFVIFFLVGLLAATFKFQILNYNFWADSFQKHNTYQNLALASKSSFESQIGKEGGNKNDVKILTDLITPENTKDVVNRNLKNLLSFVNGTTPQINVYLPIDKVPKNLLPKTLSDLKTDMSLQEVLTKFNFQDSQNLPLKEISGLGNTGSYIFIISVSLLILTLILMFVLVSSGERLANLGIAFILSGSLTFFMMQIASSLQTSLSSNLINQSSVTSVFVETLVPPMVVEIVKVWQILGFILLVIGLILFFVRKPGYNTSK